ncbi:MAG: hypothetical protein M1834_003900 [Cirrosporium novae-zelandiae]|nr:MAG: hypothetical protein M1834_003900 [Cirrosporium novae-zelandiae]
MLQAPRTRKLMASPSRTGTPSRSGAKVRRNLSFDSNSSLDMDRNARVVSAAQGSIRFDDVHQQLDFLEQYKNKQRRENDQDGIRQYFRTYRSVSGDLKEKGILSEYMQGYWFLQGLPARCASELLEEKAFDLGRPDTIQFGKLLLLAMKWLHKEELVYEMELQKLA